MNKKAKKALTLFVSIFALLNASIATDARATADGQGFIGGGIGFEMLSQEGSGTGFYSQVFGGTHFTSLLGIGLHAGFSSIGTVGVNAFDFGGFLELTDSNSGLYGRLYIDGLNATTKGAGLRHGVDGSQIAFATGIGAGIMIPAAGDLHFAPEITYRAAFMASVVNLIIGTVNVVYDL